MNDMASAMKQITAQFPDPGVLGNFLANHDVSRFRSVTASDSVAYNALVWQHLFDGIPITYYGEEQEIKTGGSDPDQRQALWAAGMGNYSTNTRTYKRIKTLNTVRKFLMSSAARVPPGNKTYLQDRSNVVLSSAADLVFTKGPALIVVNNVSRLSIDGQTKFQ
jgi:alpha-amylase